MRAVLAVLAVVCAIGSIVALATLPLIVSLALWAALGVIALAARRLPPPDDPFVRAHDDERASRPTALGWGLHSWSRRDR